MVAIFSGGKAPAATRSMPQPGVIGAPLDVLAPLLAGARARGVADALEMLSMGAILIDGQGAVLHVGARASLMMDGLIHVASRHLVGATPDISLKLAGLIGQALAGQVGSEVHISLAPGDPGLSVRAIAAPGAAHDSNQLLKVVLALQEAVA